MALNFSSRNAIARVATLCICVGAAACSDGDAPRAQTLFDSVAAASKASGIIAPDTAARTLAFAAGSAGYHVDSANGADGQPGSVVAGKEAGTLTGEVSFRGTLPTDTTVTPNRDSTGCAPFTDATFPVTRRTHGVASDALAPLVGNAVVWLVGVTHGPADNLPRRITMELDGCHLEPRIIVAPVGATIITHNRDDMIAKLHFIDYDVPNAVPRVSMGFTDAGAVVPSGLPFARPGLVEVRDERHAWIRAFLVVAPHPFVAITDADGTFSFEDVPPGSYQLVVWHERLGSRVTPVTISAAAQTSVKIEYDRINKN